MRRKHTQNNAFLQQVGCCHQFKKCQVVSTQRIRILGFVIDSVKMIVTLTKEMKLLRVNKTTIGYLEKVIATIISCVSATILRPLFYPFLENDKVTSLRLNKGNFDAPAKISLEGKQGVECWY